MQDISLDSFRKVFFARCKINVAFTAHSRLWSTCFWSSSSSWNLREQNIVNMHKYTLIATAPYICHYSKHVRRSGWTYRASKRFEPGVSQMWCSFMGLSSDVVFWIFVHTCPLIFTVYQAMHYSGFISPMSMFCFYQKCLRGHVKSLFIHLLIAIVGQGRCGNKKLLDQRLLLHELSSSNRAWLP